ncbi:Developmentally-regulated G-protein 1 [Symbiodinium microadriaticum]|uniref:Developmentally-regulated G-protein 1 n=1 Tax=Symbiodinium microadriaticum TaxID=2951 RepID=A0A1Q9C1Q8_SYMMI|nr:Developmentally-regulated G-protein 1 [Symbiodinium microadriaticum]
MPALLEKIATLELEISRTQKNKATAKHLGDLKAKLCAARRELISPEKGGGGGKAKGFEVQRFGDSRCALIGFPSVGKSSLLTALTGVQSEAAAYEFTTLTCIPGVINYNDCKIQLLDLPGIITGAAQGKGSSHGEHVGCLECPMRLASLAMRALSFRYSTGWFFGFMVALNADCQQETFPCDRGHRCVDASRICDGLVDCVDASDEANCGTAGQAPGDHESESHPGDVMSVAALEQAELARTVARAHRREQDGRKRAEQEKKLKESLLQEAQKALRSSDEEKSRCQNAEQGTECFSHVLYAMSHGIFEHPHWYPGLSSDSDFSDFQALLHLLPQNGCPRPCRGATCLQLRLQPLCLLRVDWLQQVELIQHPSWYPELTAESSKRELAKSLWQRGDPNCYRPCHLGEENDPHLLELVRTPRQKEGTHLRPASKPHPGATVPQAAAPVSTERCDEHGVTYLPLDMPGVVPQFAETARRCQELCSYQPGAAYYSFDRPTSTCHCQAAEVGMRHQGSWGFVSGSVGCNGVTLHPDTQLIVHNLDIGCYQAGVFFSGTASSESYEANSLRCQRRCQTAPELCEHFVYFRGTRV